MVGRGERDDVYGGYVELVFVLTLRERVCDREGEVMVEML